MNRTPSGFLSPNQKLRGRYFILHKIAEGGFGAVYKAEDTMLGNRLVAIKEMSQRGLKSKQEIDESTKSFEREAFLLAGLMHPHLPGIHDHFEEDGHWYLVMDFIEGETLDKYLDTLKKLPIEERVKKVIAIGIQLCTVLDYLHNQQPPIIFRDLKPLNIMRAADGHLYLIDFGIARHFKPGQPKDTIPLGSPGYASREHYGKVQTTPRSDIYSLGAILHQLLSGDDPSLLPFQFAPLSRLAIPADLGTLIMQMVEMDANNRPPSASYIKGKLQAIAALPPKHSPPPPQPQPVVPLPPFHPINQPAPINPPLPQAQQRPNNPIAQPVAGQPVLNNPASPVSQHRFAQLRNALFNRIRARRLSTGSLVALLLLIGSLFFVCSTVTANIANNLAAQATAIALSNAATTTAATQQASSATQTAIPTDTPTPIPTDTPTPTPTPPPQPGTILYDSNSDNWPSLPTSGHWYTQNNQLLNDGNGTPPLLVPYNPGDHNISNYKVVAKITRMRKNSDKQSSFGLVVRRTSDTDGYTFSICYEKDAIFGVGFICADKSYNEAVLFVGQNFPDGIVQGDKGRIRDYSAFQPVDNTEYTYSFEVKGTTITAYINDRLLVLGPVQDAQYHAGGQVGIWSSDCQIRISSLQIIAA